MPAKAKMIDFHLTPDLVHMHKDQAINDLFLGTTMVMLIGITMIWTFYYGWDVSKIYGSSETSCTTREVAKRRFWWFN